MKMKRFLVSALALFLMTSLTMTACGPTDPVDPVVDEEETVDWTTHNVLTNGKSNYKIVIPAEPKAGESMAAQELKAYFQEATNVNLQIISDSEAEWSETAQYFSVGKTSLLEDAGVTLNQKELGVNGYMLKTQGQSLFMAGGIEYGSLYAVQRFLHDVFDYEVYAVDETYCETGVTDLKLPDYYESVIPDIQQLMPGYDTIMDDQANAYRMGYQPWKELWMEGYIDGRNIEGWHNTLHFVPVSEFGDRTEWFSSDLSQLCLSNEEMYEQEFLPCVKKLIEACPDILNLSITQMDSRTWCDCTLCSADKKKYGTDAGNMIKFANKVARDVRAWLAEIGSDREVNIVIYAYHNTETAPARKNDKGEWEPIDNDVILDQDVVLWWVPSTANYKDTFYEGGNSFYGAQMEAWSVLSHTLYVWSYETRFLEYFVPYNTHNVLQKNLQFLKKYNVQLFFNQAEFTGAQSADYSALSIYLLSKLRWNVDADYEGLIKDFFMHYYDDAWETMYNSFNHLRAFMVYQEDKLGVSGNKYELIGNEKYWPMGAVDKFLADMDSAQEALKPLQARDPERYEEVKDRIVRESLSYRYLDIQLYGGSKYSSSKLLELKLAFKNDCDRLLVTSHNLYGPITTLWKDWGI